MSLEIPADYKCAMCGKHGIRLYRKMHQGQLEGGFICMGCKVADQVLWRMPIVAIADVDPKEDLSATIYVAVGPDGRALNEAIEPAAKGPEGAELRQWWLSLPNELGVDL